MDKKMSDIVQWLYSTIPFIQLFNNRFNILGFFWFIFLTLLTYFCLIRNNYSFGAKTKTLHIIGLLAISTFTIWVFYRFLDELLTIFTVLSWDSTLLSFSLEALTFWFGKILSYTIVFLGLFYLFNHLKLKQFFNLKWFNWIILVFITEVQKYSVRVFKVDYAVITGVERISAFWRFYPLLYISYTILYLSMFKGWRI